MFRVILETEKGDIELRDKPKPELGDGLRSTKLVLTPDIVVISVGGEDYEVTKDDLNAAIKPFLYSNERLELL